jgi:hypothetical protein
VILSRPGDVVEMAAEEPGGDFPDPFHMVNEPEVVLDLDVPEIVPIAHCRRCKFLQQTFKLSRGRDFFVGMASLQSQANAS